MTADPPNFLTGHVTTHASRTLMLSELQQLFAVVPDKTPLEGYFQAIINQNALHKPTRATRVKTFKYLRELYGLDSSYPFFNPLRRLWAYDNAAQPMLALLTAVTNDILLAATAETILSLEVGQPVRSVNLSQVVNTAFPQRFGEKTLVSIGQNIASSWSQSGHVLGKTNKVRSTPQASLASVVYALFLGYLAGARGLRLYETLWVRLLELNAIQIDLYAKQAAVEGFLEYRRIAEVAELSFMGLTLNLDDWDDSTLPRVQVGENRSKHVFK